MKGPSIPVATLTALLALTPVHGLLIPEAISSLHQRAPDGINKHGSSNCFWKGLQGTMPTLFSATDKIAIGTKFEKGEQIACSFRDQIGDGMPDRAASLFGNVGGICAMLCENTPEATVTNSTNEHQNNFSDVIGDLIWIGAEQCGTAPLIRTNEDGSTPGPDNLDTGCITVNYVDNVCEAKDGDPCKGKRAGVY